jgi:hypothetical protein
MTHFKLALLIWWVLLMGVLEGCVVIKTRCPCDEEGCTCPEQDSYNKDSTH